jgi:ABC-2 type transport system permease protein
VSGLQGSRALRRLAWVRLRARVRAFVTDLRRPKRLLLLLLAVAVIGLLLFSQGRMEARQKGLAQGGLTEIAAFLLLLPLLSTWAAVRQGVIAYSPEEVHFLFPAPVTTRALLLTHLLTTAAKSFSGAFIFALFLRPAGGSFLLASLGYGLYLLFCVCLQVAVDLRCLRWPAETRRARARWLLLVLLVLLAGAVALAWWQDGQRSTGWPVMRHAVLPMLPFAAVIAGGALGGAPSYPVALACVIGAVGALVWLVLAFRGDVREAAHKTSLVVAEKLAAVRSGKVFHDAPRERTRGTLLPMLPRLGGAGVHAWRQLSVLLRARKSYMLLLLLTLGVGISTSLTGQRDAVRSATAMLAVLLFAGPMYVQCDFRSDYECLAWLRTLPTPPAVLAAGQLLASALVLYLLQLVLAGWIIVVCPAEQRLGWIGAFLALPVFDLLQLAVWNGAHLLSPLRPANTAGAPGAIAVLRLYITMAAVFLTILAAVAIAGLCGAALWFALPLAGVEGVPARGVAAFVAGFAGLVTVTAVAVWCVGRLFIRVDCSRDL